VARQTRVQRAEPFYTLLHPELHLLGAIALDTNKVSSEAWMRCKVRPVSLSIAKQCTGYG